MVKKKQVNGWWHIGGKNAHGLHIPRKSTGLSDEQAAENYREQCQNTKVWPLPEPEAPKARLTLQEALDKRASNIPSGGKNLRKAFLCGTVNPLSRLTPPITHLDEISTGIFDWLMNLWREKGFTHYTQKTYREAAVMVLRWAHDNEYISRNPTKTAHKLRKPARPPADEMMKRISRDHGTIPSPLDSKGNANWQRILTALPHWVEGKAARVNPLLLKPFAPFALLLLVMYETGLRRSDAIIFRPDWILDRTDADGNRYGSYTCVQMKTGDFVTCIVPQYLVSLLRQQPLLPWKGMAARYEYHAEQAFRPGAGLFPFYDGARTEEYCNDVYLGRPLRRFGETLGFAGKNTLRPHRLRHSFAVNSLNRGVSIYDLKLLMGHSNISTTEKYTRWVTVVSDEAQKRAVACMMRQLEDARREIEARPEMMERALMARQDVYAHSPGLAIQ